MFSCATKPARHRLRARSISRLTGYNRRSTLIGHSYDRSLLATVARRSIGGHAIRMSIQSTSRGPDTQFGWPSDWSVTPNGHFPFLPGETCALLLLICLAT
jgi:hypothetical protein